MDCPLWGWVLFVFDGINTICCHIIAGKKKKLEAAEAEKQEGEEANAEKQSGGEAYDPTEVTEDADIEEEVKAEDVEMEAGMC